MAVMDFDYSKLKGRIIEKFGSIQAFAKAFGASMTSISQKLNNKVRWSSDDMIKVAELLDFKPEEISSYFFVLKVSKN